MANEDANETTSATNSPTYGITQIDDKAATSLRFERHEIDDERLYNVSFYLGKVSVGKLKNLNIEALTTAVGKENAKSIGAYPDDKGRLKGKALHNEYGLSPQEDGKRLKQAYQAAPLEQEEALNTVEEAPKKEYESVDMQESLARLARHRQRERKALARERARQSRSNQRGQRHYVKRAANQQNTELDAHDKKEQQTEHNSYANENNKDKSVEAAIKLELKNQFYTINSKYYYKDQLTKVVFKDNGDKIATAINDPQVAQAMAKMAEAKGWKNIKVSGHPDFKREIWIEASIRGLSVQGFKPTERDLQMLEERSEQRMRNTIEHNSPSALRTQDDQSSRHFKGTIMEHGKANFEHDPQKKENYYVKLNTEQGEYTIWGVDLSRAVAESGAKLGDEVTLGYKGSQPVIVENKNRDKTGQVIGKERVQTHRNTWEIAKSDKQKIAEAVASAYIEANVKDKAQRDVLKAAVDARLNERAKTGRIPDISIYDKSAPSKAASPEKAQPVVERQAERTR